MKKQCFFCDNDLSCIGEYAVCKSCETVRLSKGLPTQQIYQLITEYLREKQNQILLKKKDIYELDSKQLNGRDLSDEEKSTCECLKRFQDSRMLLETAAAHLVDLGDKQIRHALYDLICISEELDAFLAK